jgi:hypothetical protein
MRNRKATISIDSMPWPRLPVENLGYRGENRLVCGALLRSDTMLEVVFGAEPAPPAEIFTHLVHRIAGVGRS